MLFSDMYVTENRVLICQHRLRVAPLSLILLNFFPFVIRFLLKGKRNPEIYMYSHLNFRFSTQVKIDVLARNSDMWVARNK